MIVIGITLFSNLLLNEQQPVNLPVSLYAARERPTSDGPHRKQFLELLSFMEMEQVLGLKAIKDFQPLQPGDVVATAADTQVL